MQAGLLIAETEKVSKKDVHILRLAIWLHDSGFTRTYKGHEEAGCDIAKEMLPSFRISMEDIEAVSYTHLISDVTRYCSRVGEFTNAGATYNSANDVAAPDCWTNTSHDIWFRFVAVASDVQILSLIHI